MGFAVLTHSGPQRCVCVPGFPFAGKDRLRHRAVKMALPCHGPYHYEIGNGPSIPDGHAQGWRHSLVSRGFPGMHKALGSISNTNRAWCGIAVIPALRRRWQEDREFKIILGYIKIEASLGYTRPCLQNPKPNQTGHQIEAWVSDPEG